jgi:hypothetical protein
MLEMRFCARKRVRRRGCRGKLPSCAISLSVRSMASLSCSFVSTRAHVWKMGSTYSRSSHVLNGGNLVT